MTNHTAAANASPYRPRIAVALGLTALLAAGAACAGENDDEAATETTIVADVTTTATASVETGFAEPWAPYEIDGQFVVELPGEPVVDTREVATAFGPATLDLYQVLADDAGVGLSVTPAPGVAEDANAIELMLAGAVAGMGQNLGGSVVSDEPLGDGTYPGRDAEILVADSGQSLVIFTRVLYVGGRLFQLQSLGIEEDRDVVRADFTRLLDTFVPAAA